MFLATRFILSPMGEVLELHASATGSYKKADQPILYEFQCAARAPRSVLWNGERLEQFLDQQIFEAAPSGWYYHHTTHTCLVKCGNGRSLASLKVDFGYFDLIRM